MIIVYYFLFQGNFNFVCLDWMLITIYKKFSIGPTKLAISMQHRKQLGQISATTADKLAILVKVLFTVGELGEQCCGLGSKTGFGSTQVNIG